MERGPDIWEYRFADSLSLEWKVRLDREQATEPLEECRMELLERRDRAIVACVISVALSVISLINYDFRRSPLIIFISLSCAVMSVLGLHGVTAVKLYEVLFYLMINSALASVCCICLAIESIFLQPEPGDPLAGMSWVMYILMVPYAIVLACCVPPLLMAKSIIQYTDLEEDATGLPSDDAIRQQVRIVRNGDLCCVCMEAQKDAACLPCGHKCMCINCGQQLVASGGRSCPICRKSIKSIQQIFE